MLKRLNCSESLADIFLNKVLEEFFRLLGVPLERLVVKVKVTFDHISDDFEFWVPREGHLARHHNVENHPKWPNVYFRVVVLEENFGGDVVGLEGE